MGLKAVVSAGGTKTSEVNEYTNQQYFGTVTLVEAATISWDLDIAQVAEVTLTADRILGAPTNMKDGGTYILRVIGAFNLAYDSVFKFSGGTVPEFAGSTNILTCVSDGVSMHTVASTEFS